MTCAPEKNFLRVFRQRRPALALGDMRYERPAFQDQTDSSQARTLVLLAVNRASFPQGSIQTGAVLNLKDVSCVSNAKNGDWRLTKVLEDATPAES
ncbi:hypothetical protein PG984_011140 [Apiospora sp. TS-2023a]